MQLVSSSVQVASSPSVRIQFSDQVVQLHASAYHFLPYRNEQARKNRDGRKSCLELTLLSKEGSLSCVYAAELPQQIDIYIRHPTLHQEKLSSDCPKLSNKQQ